MAQGSSARWITLVLGCAVVASAIVVYALVRMTAPGGGDSEAGTSAAPSASGAQLVSSPSTIPADPSASAPPESAAPSADPAPSASPGGTASSAASAGTSGPPPPTTSELAGSQVVVPASWSGTATVTVTVMGECATGNPSVYSDLPADLALDLIQNEASAAEEDIAPGHRGAVNLSLGINSSGVPSLAVYSSNLDDSGRVHRYWQLHLVPGKNRTMIDGQLANGSNEGSNPNIMVDAETSLQPCESSGTVSLPRVLADGSTLTGWVTQTRARLTLHATTTDHKRSVTVEVRAERKK